MPLPTRTKVWRPSLADTVEGDRVGWIAPPGHYPVEYDCSFIESVENPNARKVERREPPDDSGDWAVVWWQGLLYPDGTRGKGGYSWEYVPWLEVLEYPDPQSS